MNDDLRGFLKENARRLRKEMTREERRLWYDFLKKLPLTIRRQYIVNRYILDFYCPQHRLAIELDGCQHYEPDGLAADKTRDMYLTSMGITVLRYSNHDINSNFEGVCRDILSHMGFSDFPALWFET